MSVTTTFGYSATEDRLWMRCDGWPQRVWLTRRTARAMVQALVRLIETTPAPGDTAGAPSASERAAAEHDAALNRPRPSESGQALRMGRAAAADTRELANAVLCRKFTLIHAGGHADLVFGTSAGEWRLRLTRAGLHRWLRGLQLALAPAQWSDWPAVPDWLTRSYLPPALQKLLDAPLPPASERDADHGGDAASPG